MVVENANTADFKEVVTTESSTYGTSYQKLFASLFNNPLFSDIRIIINGESFPGHRLILSVQSSVLKSLIDSSTNNSIQINLSSVEPRIFKQMLQFLYSGNINKLTETDVLQLLTIAEEYKVEILKNACGEILADGSSQDNVAYLLDIANRFNCHSLKNRCGRFMAENFSDLMDTHKLMSLDVDIWKGIVMSPIVKTRSEEHLFEAVLQYSQQFDAEKQRRTLEMLLPHILFIRMKPEYLVKHVETNPLLKNIPLVVDQLYQAFRHKALPSKTANIPKRKYDICFEGTTLLNGEHAQILSEWTDNKEWSICYKASKDGWDASAFHRQANNVGPTLTIIQSSNNFLFGGYTTLNWTSSSGYAYDGKSWLFSLTNPSGAEPIRMLNDGPNHSNAYSIYDHASYGPTFGGGHDLYIVSNANTNGSSYTNLGHSFSLKGYQYGQPNIKNYFAGAYNFLVTEIEVFKLNE